MTSPLRSDVAGTSVSVCVAPSPLRSRAVAGAQGLPSSIPFGVGKFVWVNLWAAWCAPCKASMPWLNELSQKYKDQGVEILGISMDEEGWNVVKPFIEQMGVKYPIVVGNKRVGYLYGEVDNLPVAFFVDRNQKVAGIHLGAATKKQFESTIQALLKQ